MKKIIETPRSKKLLADVNKIKELCESVIYQNADYLTQEVLKKEIVDSNEDITLVVEVFKRYLR